MEALRELKKGLGIGKTKRGIGGKIMAIADSDRLPVAKFVTSASSYEITLVKTTSDNI
jgi:hypothetical protein